MLKVIIIAVLIVIIAATAASLADEFNAFLKAKGLEGTYTVSVTEK